CACAQAKADSQRTKNRKSKRRRVEGRKGKGSCHGEFLDCRLEASEVRERTPPGPSHQHRGAAVNFFTLGVTKPSGPDAKKHCARHPAHSVRKMVCSFSMRRRVPIPQPLSSLPRWLPRLSNRAGFLLGPGGWVLGACCLILACGT